MSTTNNSINSPIPTTVPNGGTGRATATTAYGTICAGTTATGAQQTVSPGSSGAPLVSGGASSLPSYTTLLVGGGGTGLTTATTAYSPICAGTTATGAFQAASTGLSTSGYVFTSNGSSSLPSFQATSATAGGLVLLGTVSASGSASVSFSKLLTSSYDNYLVTWENMINVTSTAILTCELGYGSTPTYLATGYSGTSAYAFSTTVACAAASTTYIQCGSGTYASGTQPTFTNGGTLYLFNANNSTNAQNTITMGATVNPTETTTIVSWIAQSIVSGQTINSLKFLATTGNISTGTFYLYGYQN